MTIRQFIYISLITNRYLTRPVPYCTVLCIWHLSNRALCLMVSIHRRQSCRELICTMPATSVNSPAETHRHEGCPVPLGIRQPQETACLFRCILWLKTLLKIEMKKKHVIFKQCCGSGSTGSGSTCFWASRIRIRIHWSEVWIRIRILLWIRILLSSCKNSKKNIDSYYFVTVFDFLSLKNDVNVAWKCNKQKKLC